MSQSHCTQLRAAQLLSSPSISDEEFFEASGYLSTRFDRRSADLDIRRDESAPQILYDWFRHARSRVPDFRVWSFGCLIENFFDIDFGLYLPVGWSHSHMLSLNESLRTDPKWEDAVRKAYAELDQKPNVALTCCAADRWGLDPDPKIWAYLLTRPDDLEAWCAVSFRIGPERLPEFIGFAEAELVPRVLAVPRGLDFDAGADDDEVGERWPILALWKILRKLEIEHDFHGAGMSLLECAVRSCDAGLRGLAVQMLSFPEYWRRITEITIEFLEDARQREHRKYPRENLDRLLESVKGGT